MGFDFLYKGKEKKTEDVAQQEQKELVNAIWQVKEELEHTRVLFDSTDDFDLIEAYIHQINALNARYNFLIKKAKKQDTNAKEYAKAAENRN